MLFNSFDFLLFFPLVCLLYFLIPEKLKNYWLLAASYYFYMCWNAKYALLLLFSTAATFLSGLAMEQIKTQVQDKAKERRYKNVVVAVCFTVNIGILFFFKYCNYCMVLLGRLLSVVGIGLSVPAFDIILPVGISFYTFQALSYTMDVYRGEIYAEKNFFRYALFVSFFPQLVAGPIERSKNLLRQLAVPKKFDFDAAKKGLLLMLWGYFMKLVLADRIAIFVDSVYTEGLPYGGWYLIVATVLFAFQIYCDFAGYSTIAIGAAKILNIRLMENFDAPYLSTSVAEFWRHWHISLTSWFKDYLYIPLGGSRKGTARKYLNKMIVFLVSGLWHGANLTFVVWGGLNGAFQVIGEMLQPVRDRLVRALNIDRRCVSHRLLKLLVTFALVDFTWIFFRAENISQGIEIVRSIFTASNPWVLFDESLCALCIDGKNFRLMLLCIGVLLGADCAKKRGIRISDVICRQSAVFQMLFIVAAICFILVFGAWGPDFNQAAFIYFQF